MEKILVVMDPQKPLFFAGIHALNLAKRINAKVYFLLVFPPKEPGKPAEDSNEAAVKQKVKTLLEEARSDGLTVDYYLAYGNYESELVSFVQENKITLLVVESSSERGESRELFREFLDKLRHRINCRIEVVNEKPENLGRKEDNSVAPVFTNRGK